MKLPNFRLDLTFGEYYVLSWMFHSQMNTGEYFSPKAQFMERQKSLEEKFHKAWKRHIKKTRPVGKS